MNLSAGYPSWCSPLVEPKLEKIDVPHLKRDIRKFYEAGVFSDDDNEWWVLFFDSFMLKYGQVPDQAPPWPVDGFATALAPPTPPAVQLSSRIEDLRNAEVTAPPQVLL